MRRRLHPAWIVAIIVGFVILGDIALFALRREGGVDLLLQQLLNALTLGGIYALIAVGYTLIYGIVKLINFAHGEIYMLGAFFGVLLISQGMSFLAALGISMVACAIISMTMDQIAYRPLRQQASTPVLISLVVGLAGVLLSVSMFYVRGRIGFLPGLGILLATCLAFIYLAERFAFKPTAKQSPRLSALITAIGMSLLLQNVAMLIFGAEQRPFPDLRQDREVVISMDGDPAPGHKLPGKALAVGDLLILREHLEASLLASREGRIEDVPFHYGYLGLLRSIETGRRLGLDNVAEKEDAARQAAGELARVRKFEIDEREGKLLVALEFTPATTDQSSQEFRRDLKAWLRNPTQAQKAAVLKPGLGLAFRDEIEFEDRQGVHPFQLDLVDMTLGPPADGARRSFRMPVKIVIVWVSALTILAAMTALVYRSRFGAAMRACALDRDAASLMGINANRIILITFALSGAMAAVAGVLYGLYLGSGIGYRMGFYAGVMAFFAAVFGGIGNLKGAVLGGLILGFVQSISKAYFTDWATARIGDTAALLGFPELAYTFNSEYSYAIVCIILISVILIRPKGILGSLEADRA